MFQMINITTGKPVVVYAIQGGLLLIWNDENATQYWEWADMNLFRPVTAEDRMRGRV